jgi:hypothetical protein
MCEDGLVSDGMIFIPNFNKIVEVVATAATAAMYSCIHHIEMHWLVRKL